MLPSLLLVSMLQLGAQTQLSPDAPAPLSCTINLAPDQLIIQGGISAQSVSPKEGSTRITQQLGALQQYVKSQGGTLEVLDRLRAARLPDASNGEDSKLPFLQVQRVRASFPAQADIDEILERFFKLGLDRFGENIEINAYRSREFQQLTHFSISNLATKLEQFRARCMNSACDAKLNSVCAQQSTSYATLIGPRMENREQLRVPANKPLSERTLPVLKFNSAAPVRFEITGSDVYN